MGELKELLDRVDTLTFESEELEIEADIENLPEVMSFIEKRLEKTDCSLKDINQISVAAEEIFSNISHYAYAPETGAAYIRVETSEDPITVTLTFMDGGMPYDPLSKEDPDVALSADEREIGGLGIFLVKNIMDDIEYKYENGKNILILKKEIQK
ncbi:MAG: ATP-binding protein [Bacillota bacterium]|nr:ATP-binding protein [Bacillota bacterium]